MTVKQPQNPGPFKKIVNNIRKTEQKIILLKPLFLVLLMLANMSSGAFFGYNVGITGVAKDSLINSDPVLLNNSTQGAFVQAIYGASFFGGNIFGPIMAPICIYFIGYKILLLITALVGLVGQVTEVFAPHYYVLCVGRFIVGVAVGITIVVGTEYSGSLAKIYLPRFKGMVGTMFLVGFSTSILLANVAVFFQNVVYSWRWIMACAVFANVALLIISIVMPESPIWVEGKVDKNALSIPQQLKILFTTPAYIGRMFLCFVLVMSYLGGGVVTMKNYLPFTLEQAGIKDFYERAGASIGVAGWNFISAIGTTFIINWYGRKTLLGIGYIIMFISTMSLALVIYFVPSPTSGYISIGIACFFLIGNNGGINSLIFFIFNELFPPEITVVSSALMFTMFQIMEFIVGFAYLPLQDALSQSGILLLFACNTCVCGIILMMFLPETKIPSPKKGKKGKQGKTDASSTQEEKEGEKKELKDVSKLPKSSTEEQLKEVKKIVPVNNEVEKLQEVTATVTATE